jgi:hypothetical protein
VDINSINELKERFLQQLIPELNEYFAPIGPVLSNYLEYENRMK